MNTIPANIAQAREDRQPRAPNRVSIVKDGAIDLNTHDFEEFYLEQYPTMVRLAYALVDTTAQAEEVTQDAFAAVLERWHRVDNHAAYLRVTVINRCRRVQRRRMWLRARGTEPVDDAKLVYNHLIDATRRLPHRQQAMIALRYDLQLSDSEIADTLGLPIGTVKSNIHRALATLRQEISK